MRVFTFVLLLNIFQTVQACEVIDDAGRVVRLSHPAQRIISLAPDLTEILFAAGAGNKIVGVMQGSDYPAAAKKILTVAQYNTVNLEQVLALHPDLIVAWEEGTIPAQLKKLNLPLYLSHQHKLTDIPQTLMRLGCLAGTDKQAERAAMNFKQQYYFLQKKYARPKTISVFYQLWNQPLMTVGRASWINEVIELCGGKNIFSDLYGAAPEVNIESVINRNPKIIFSTEKNNWRDFWWQWPEIDAVKNHRLVYVDADLIERAGPRILQGAKTLCQAIAVT